MFYVSFKICASILKFNKKIPNCKIGYDSFYFNETATALKKKEIIMLNNVPKRLSF